MINTSSLKFLVKRTQSYFAYFHYPISPEEVWFYLPTSTNISFESITPYVADLTIEQRRKRLRWSRLTRQKLQYAEDSLRFIFILPTVLFVGLTGSLAVNHIGGDDDVDLLIITAPHTLWLTRLFVSIYLSLRGVLRSTKRPNVSKNLLCLNIWLDSSSLAMAKSRHNLYTAHEIVQMRPLYDTHNTWISFLQHNLWADKLLHHAYQQRITEACTSSVEGYKFSKFISYIVYPLNLFTYLIQIAHMRPKMTTEMVSYNSAFFHKYNFYNLIRRHLNHS